LPGSGVSLGGSIPLGKLRSLDGVDLLYPGSARSRNSAKQSMRGSAY